MATRVEHCFEAVSLWMIKKISTQGNPQELGVPPCSREPCRGGTGFDPEACGEACEALAEAVAKGNQHQAGAWAALIPCLKALQQFSLQPFRWKVRLMESTKEMARERCACMTGRIRAKCGVFYVNSFLLRDGRKVGPIKQPPGHRRCPRLVGPKRRANRPR